MVAVPVALLLIFVLLYFTFHSVKQTLLIYSAVPMAAIGGVFALWIRGMNFSISAGVGFIALFGVAVLNGIVLIAEFNRLEKDGVSDITERVLKGLQIRLRPVIMTAAVASLGFLPMALSTSAGAEVQKPLATVVIGGLISATLLTLVILPIFYIAFGTARFKLNTRSNSSKMLFLAISLIAGTMFLNQANAQETRYIKLDEAVKTALENNLQVKSSQLSVDVQKALKGSTVDLGKTSVGFEYGQINSFTKDNSYSISQSMAFPTVYINQGKLAGANIKSSEWELKGSQLDIATQVKQVYWQLAYLYSKKRLLIYQDSLFSGFQRAAELRAKSGETNQLEMITARSQSMDVKNRLHQAASDIGITARKFRTLLNSEADLIPSDTILIKAGKLPEADSIGIALNPSLGYINQQVELSKIEKQLERSKMMPDLSVGYFSQTMQGTQDVDGIPRVFGPGDRFTGIQAGISVPLWFVPYTSKAKAAAIGEKAAAARAEYFSKTLTGEFRSMLDEYTKYSESVIYYEKQAIPEADMIIGQSTRSYKAGALDYLEYILNLNRALEIKQNYLDALNSLNQTFLNIEFITGKTF
jgi:cobalt-zinc-cadmium resistance protein CzcA